MFIWTVPDESVDFVYDQFNRIKVDPPEECIIDVGIAFVIEYVAQYYHYPTSSKEAIYRFSNPYLTVYEEENILFSLKKHLQDKEQFNFTESHLRCLIWATLLFCWSEAGEYFVDWFRRMEINYGEEAIPF